MYRYRNYLNPDAKQLIIDEIEKNGSCDVWYNIDHVSSSGMTRYITMRLLPKNGNGEFIILADEKKIQGCGMDMVFALLYDYIVHDLSVTNKVTLREF